MVRARDGTGDRDVLFIIMRYDKMRIAIHGIGARRATTGSSRDGSKGDP